MAIAGVELRKERRLGEVLSDSFNILLAHWKQLAAISVPLIVANVAFSLVLVAISVDLPAPEVDTEDATVSNDELEHLGLLLGVLVLSLPIFIVLYQLVGAAIVAYLTEIDRGASLAPAEALDRAQEKLGILAGAGVRSYAIIFLLTITVIGIPWALNRAVRWIFLAQVIMLEGKQGEEVLAASSDVVKGQWWSTAGRLLVAGLVIGLPISLLAGAVDAAIPGVIGTVLSAATVFITVSYGIISTTLIYFHLKSRRSHDDSIRSPGESAS